ncbi:MAG: hypothetical protein ABEJ74_08610 [Haloferacaceae archaeon]
MGLGIIQTLELAAALMFAVPVAGFGVSRLLAGDATVGAALLVIALLMVAVPYRLTTPGDLPGKAAEKAVGSAVDVEDER